VDAIQSPEDREEYIRMMKEMPEERKLLLRKSLP